jgi:hypothetical protein
MIVLIVTLLAPALFRMGPGAMLFGSSLMTLCGQINGQSLLPRG